MQDGGDCRLGSFRQYFEFKGCGSTFLDVDTARLGLENKFRNQPSARSKAKVRLKEMTDSFCGGLAHRDM
jgi:hypothetical protein